MRGRPHTRYGGLLMETHFPRTSSNTRYSRDSNLTRCDPRAAKWLHRCVSTKGSSASSWTIRWAGSSRIRRTRRRSRSAETHRSRTPSAAFSGSNLYRSKVAIVPEVGYSEIRTYLQTSPREAFRDRTSRCLWAHRWGLVLISLKLIIGVIGIGGSLAISFNRNIKMQEINGD